MTNRLLPLLLILAACASSAPPPVAAPQPAPEAPAEPITVAPAPEAPPPAPAAVVEAVPAPPEPEIPPGIKPEPPPPPPKRYTEAEVAQIISWIEWVEDHCELEQPESILTQGVCNPVCPPQVRVWPCPEYQCPKGTDKKWIEAADRDICMVTRNTGRALLVEPQGDPNKPREPKTIRTY